MQQAANLAGHEVEKLPIKKGSNNTELFLQTGMDDGRSQTEDHRRTEGTVELQYQVKTVNESTQHELYKCAGYHMETKK